MVANALPWQLNRRSQTSGALIQEYPAGGHEMRDSLCCTSFKVCLLLKQLYQAIRDTQRFPPKPCA